ncbi:SemiSWEET family sugar transporter, partial [Streptomyces sp. NPDC101151]|uniref:SemiSWEET family sugar transporter n=1 Tax=Streptomyces sp. NPDC101151 TaxID=3366115 RepID=UPI0038195A70
MPQLYKSWRTRSTRDFSWGYLAFFSTGIGLWLLYGILIGDLALIVSNGMTITLTLGVIGLKLWLETIGGSRNTGPGATVSPAAGPV